MAMSLAPLRVGTLNVRGLRARRRQRQLRRVMLEEDLDILAIQETKIESESQTDGMVVQFSDRYTVCVSHAVGTAAGCCMFIKRGLGIVEETVISCQSGRFVFCDFVYCNKEFRIICVYAPTKVTDRLSFFQEISQYMKTDRYLIVLGDFNCVLNSDDRSHAGYWTDKSVEFLRGAIGRALLEDIAHYANGGNNRHYTHFQGNSHARLDRAYLSQEIATLCDDYKVLNIAFSDHCLVAFTMGKKITVRPRMNWETWKLNAKLLKDEQFLKSVRTEMAKANSSYERGWCERWERFKEAVKMNAIERAVEMRFEERQEENNLKKMLQELLDAETAAPGTFMEEIRRTKCKLEAIDTEKYRGALVRARTEKILADEMPTKRALGAEKKYARRNEIVEIEYKGKICRDAEEINYAFKEHYRELFNCRIPNKPGYESHFQTTLPRLDAEETERLSVDITAKEIQMAIEDLNAGKSPGPDGLTAVFYKAFCAQIAIVLEHVFKEAYQAGRLPPSFKRAYTILIPKSNDANKLNKITGYRPITLTNVDYKILMKIFARRLQGVIGDLVGPHQTCGIRGRSIFTNIHVARSILETCDADFRKVAMLQIDLEKAFDRVCHDLLFSILDYVGVGSLITEGVKMAYNNCTTNLIINHELTERIEVRSSVRQGCPLSPLLFALYLEALCKKIIDSPDVRGFSLEGCEVRLLAYADDVVVFCTDKESVRTSMKIMREFCDMTGSNINLNKCVGLWHGQWQTTPRVFEGMQWTLTPGIYLGVPLGTHRDTKDLWNGKVQELKAQTDKWAGRDLSIFARAAICRIFLVSKLWYLMQVLSCSRFNFKKFHRAFAVFVWQSEYERTSRNNLFRKLGQGGLSLPNLFLKQLVSRFLFLRDTTNPFLRTVIQVRLSNALPNFVVSMREGGCYATSKFLREVVVAFRFLNHNFSTEYLATVTRKRISADLIDIMFPEPLYRLLYREGQGKDVLKRVKRMMVPGGVKTFFFKLHTNTLPVKTWLEEKGHYLPWGTNCLICKKPESIEHVFLDCWSAVFFWDIMQRTIKKELPLTPHGIRYLTTGHDSIPYDTFFLLGLHSIWRNRMAVRNCDINPRTVNSYFTENVSKLREVFKKLGYEDELLFLMDALVKMKVL